MHYNYLIIGGGVAGVVAAETIRGRAPMASIGILSNEIHPLYSRVLLPSYLKGKIPREKVFLRTLGDFTEKRIDLMLERSVRRVNAESKEVILAGGPIFSYDKLLIASGGRVNDFSAGSTDADVFFRLQTIDDADMLRASISEIRSPLVVGASFIGLEFLELRRKGREPALVFRRIDLAVKVVGVKNHDARRTGLLLAHPETRERREADEEERVEALHLD